MNFEHSQVLSIDRFTALREQTQFCLTMDERDRYITVYECRICKETHTLLRPVDPEHRCRKCGRSTEVILEHVRAIMS